MPPTPYLAPADANVAPTDLKAAPAGVDLATVLARVFTSSSAVIKNIVVRLCSAECREIDSARHRKVDTRTKQQRIQDRLRLIQESEALTARKRKRRKRTDPLYKAKRRRAKVSLRVSSVSEAKRDTLVSTTSTLRLVDLDVDVNTPQQRERSGEAVPVCFSPSKHSERRTDVDFFCIHSPRAAPSDCFSIEDAYATDFVCYADLRESPKSAIPARPGRVRSSLFRKSSPSSPLSRLSKMNKMARFSNPLEERREFSVASGKVGGVLERHSDQSRESRPSPQCYRGKVPECCEATAAGKLFEDAAGKHAEQNEGSTTASSADDELWSHGVHFYIS